MTAGVDQRLADLREQIRRHEYLYYVLDNPEITDAQFDALFSELRQLDQWRREQPDLPSRSEAIRRLMEAGMSTLKPILSASTTKPGKKKRTSRGDNKEKPV